MGLSQRWSVMTPIGYIQSWFLRTHGSEHLICLFLFDTQRLFHGEALFESGMLNKGDPENVQSSPGQN